ncbi:methyltransferase domain-containing protein [Nocardioides ginkgobilobae]
MERDYGEPVAGIGGWWERHVVPRLVEKALGSGDVRRERAAVCEGLSGRVLEVGFGSGMNLPHLPAGVTSLDAVEPSDLGWAMSASRRDAARLPVSRVGLDGQHLDVEDAAYDAVLCTFSLCTIPDAALGAREMARAVRPGGTVHVLEHGASPDPRVRRWQARLDPIERAVAGGCHLTRDPVALVRAAGLEVGEVTQRYLPGAGVSRPWTYGYRFVARRP